MYGLVFEIVEEFVIEKQGIDVWHVIKEKAGCKVKDGAFLRRSYYPDSEIVDLIVAASEVLGVAVPDILEVFGHFVVRHHYLNGYNDLMRAQGSTLRKWLSNLNAMHDHIQKSFPGNEFQAPIFWCEDCTTVEGSILLHYFSLRGTLLVPMVVGIIKELASFQFDCEVTMSQLALQGEDGSEFTTWRITAVNPADQYKLSPSVESRSAEDLKVDFNEMEMPSNCPFSGKDLSSEGNKKAPGKCPYSSNKDHDEGTESTSSIVSTASRAATFRGLSLSKIQSVFPFHLIVDKNFNILQVGEGLPGLMEKPLEYFLGKRIGDVLDITRPVLGSSWDWTALKKLADQHFFMAPVSDNHTLKRRVSMEDARVKFKASMIEIANGEVIFALNPDARNVVELRKMGLTLTDLPLHSCQRDSVFLGEYIKQEVDKAHKLDKLSKRLECEKNLSNTLLYNLLPKNIADELRSGKTVEPKQHENVTLFFSDIEGFTSICDKVDPWAVIDMLNQLYSVMDHLASHFDLYKVETIGDAYMCCSGLPLADEYHAENVANFAICVRECVKLVRSPVDGCSLNLRIGIHTGSCTAGVVGTLTPHYCLFGDMVNTTARHESTGQAGKIQCSSELFGRLKHFSKYEDEQFQLAPRGLVRMKGKSDKYTYWLESGTENNKRAGPAAVEELRKEVMEMLETKTWKMRRYFRRSGALRGDMDAQSVSSAGTHRTSSTSDDNSYIQDVSDRLRVSMSSQGAESHQSGTKEEASVAEDPALDYSVDRDMDDIDQMLQESEADLGPLSENCLDNLVWHKSLTREDFVSNIHLLLSPLLRLCLFDESTGHFPDTMDLLDGQLYGFIDSISKVFKKQNPYHNFRRTAHVVAWANQLFERIQDSGAGHTGSVENGPWFRFTLSTAALVRDCKHSGVSDDQLQAEQHMVSEMFGGDKCQIKHSLTHGLDVLASSFPQLYDEIVWGCPRFLHLVRRTALMEDPSNAFERAMSCHEKSLRQVMAKTEAAMALVLKVANLGHFALDEMSFLEWNEAAFAEKRLANLAKRGSDPLPNWHKQCMQFMKGEVLPLVDKCEVLMPKTVCIRDTVALNLKNFEAQGKHFAESRIFPRRSAWK